MSLPVRSQTPQDTGKKRAGQIADLCHYRKPGDVKMKRFCEAVIDMVDHIRQEIADVDFWRSRPAQEILKKWIIYEIDDLDLVPFEKQEKLADRFVELAKAIHTRLVAT